MARSVRFLVAFLLVADAVALMGVQGLLTLAALPIHDEAPGGALAGLALAVAAGQLASLALAGAYRRDSLFAGHREYAAVMTGLSGAAIAVAVGAYLADVEVSRQALALNWSLSILALGPLRFGARRLVYRLRHRGLFVERLLVVGADAHAVAVARQMDAPLEHGLKVAGFLDDYHSPGSPITDGLAVLAEPRALPQVAQREGIARVVVVPQALTWESLHDILETAARSSGLRVQMAPTLHQLLTWSRRPVQGGPIPLFELESLAIRAWDAVAKRTLDLTLAALLLPALAVELTVSWACALFDGGGPLIQRRRALGRLGRPLALLALAPPGAPEPMGGPRLKRGAWRLRWALARGRWGKLPNLVNVITGRMSLVGPRALPDAPGDASSSVASSRGRFPPGRGGAPSRQVRRPNGVDDAWLLALSSVRPGLTGPATPAGQTSDPEEQALLDVTYIRDYSPWLDLRLLFASARRALRRELALPVSYSTLTLEPVGPGPVKELL